METEVPRKTGLSPAVIIVVILVLGGLAAVCFGLVLKQRQHRARATALNNLKHLSVMLFEFEDEYGGFPDDSTAVEVRRKTKTDFTLTGPYSNDYFRQMLVGGGGRTELPFWCPTPQSPISPDNNFSTSAKALAPGEVGYSYVMASPTQALSASGEPSRPLLVAPSLDFRPDWTFDRDVFTGQAVVLRLDCSATIAPIREDNKKASTGSGKTLGDTGEGTAWGTTMTPVLRAPQPR